MTILRRPLNVRCGRCEHVWAPIYTPMEMLTAATILKTARCPRCGADSSQLFTALDQDSPSQPKQETAK